MLDVNTSFGDLITLSSGAITGQRVQGGETVDRAETSFPEIGGRLKSLRIAFSRSGESQMAWAERHGVSQSKWNNWERGLRRISLEHAEKLVDLYGLSLDWIYRGRVDGLSENARNKLSSQ